LALFQAQTLPFINKVRTNLSQRKYAKVTLITVSEWDDVLGYESE